MDREARATISKALFILAPASRIEGRPTLYYRRTRSENYSLCVKHTTTAVA
jgi:hypothetical protein